MKKRIARAPEEPLMEERLQVQPSGALVTVRKNLGPLALTQMMSASREGDLRGLMVGPDIYYWDAFYATHHEIAGALGVPYDVANCVQIWRQGDNDNFAALVDIRRSPNDLTGAIEKLKHSPNIYFMDENEVWQPGSIAA